MPPQPAVIVTGASSGLGLWTSRYLLEAGRTVILACRNEAKARQATRQLPANAADRWEIRSLDLADLAAVERFADALPTESSYDLVCNAGLIYQGPTRYTVDGIEEIFGVNHLGHFYLTRLLLARVALRKVVVVSSLLHDPAKWSPFPKPALASVEQMARPSGSIEAAYPTSKLCNVLFAYELHRRYGDRLLANAYNPGFMPDTGFGMGSSPGQRLSRRLLSSIGPLLGFAIRAKDSARHLARLITHEQRSGLYFDCGREARSSVESYDQAKAQALWNESETLLASLRPPRA